MWQGLRADQISQMPVRELHQSLGKLASVAKVWKKAPWALDDKDAELMGVGLCDKNGGGPFGSSNSNLFAGYNPHSQLQRAFQLRRKRCNAITQSSPKHCEALPLTCRLQRGSERRLHGKPGDAKTS